MTPASATRPVLAEASVSDRLAGYLRVVVATRPTVEARSSLFVVALLAGTLDGLDGLDVVDTDEDLVPEQVELSRLAVEQSIVDGFKRLSRETGAPVAWHRRRAYEHYLRSER
jgi:hypothetical protein